LACQGQTGQALACQGQTGHSLACQGQTGQALACRTRHVMMTARCACASARRSRKVGEKPHCQLPPFPPQYAKGAAVPRRCPDHLRGRRDPAAAGSKVSAQRGCLQQRPPAFRQYCNFISVHPADTGQKCDSQLFDSCSIRHINLSRRQLGVGGRCHRPWCGDCIGSSRAGSRAPCTGSKTPPAVRSRHKGRPDSGMVGKRGGVREEGGWVARELNSWATDVLSALTRTSGSHCKQQQR